MNRKQLKKMCNAVLRLSPAPIVIDDDGGWKALDVLWRGRANGEHIQIETMSGASGFALRLPFDSIREWQSEDHYHPSFDQGRLMLKAWWIILPEGHPPRSIPI